MYQNATINLTKHEMTENDQETHKLIITLEDRQIEIEIHHTQAWRFT